MFRRRQGLPLTIDDDEPRRPDAGSLLVRELLHDVPPVVFPGGYTVRPMRLDEVGLWLDILHSTPEYAHLPPGTFEQEFGADLQAVQWRCFIVTDQRGVAVGTVSAWYDRDFRGQDWGRIAWLVIRPGRRGIGLEAAAAAFAVGQLAQWHERCYAVVGPGNEAETNAYARLGFRHLDEA